MDTRSSESDARGAPRHRNWLSRGLESLAAQLAERGARPGADYDVVIVGSGYGGAMAAAGLAGCHCAESGLPWSVCVLERGKEYLPGAFPSRLAELPGHLRFSTPSGQVRGQREGLFDLRMAGDANVLLANGLGGGSLINAGVLEEPAAAVRQALERLAPGLAGHFASARSRLIAAHDGNTLQEHGIAAPAKLQALEKLGQQLKGGKLRQARISVALEARNSSAQVRLDRCVQCGDCVTGCNFNAKESLDTNLLVEAWRHGAELYTGATVLRLEADQAAKCWLLHLAYTDPGLRERQPAPLVLRAGKVILAAGALGSTEILLRSQTADLQFSGQLGCGFSSNGDMIAAVYGQQAAAHPTDDENTAACARQVGPTITGIVDVPAQAEQPGFVVEELGIPAPLRRVLEEVLTTTHTLDALASADESTHDNDGSKPDPCAVDARAIERSSLLAIMGDDGAAGALELAPGGADGEGSLRVRWPALRNSQLFQGQMAALSAACAGLAPGAQGEPPRLLANPLWKTLPDSMEFLLSGRRGPPLTVHPLGGCCMAQDSEHGVVDDCGRVFRRRKLNQEAYHQGLVVLDGAIVPRALGINPALTIAALAERAIVALRKQWQLARPPEAGLISLPQERPRFQAPPSAGARSTAPTMVDLRERLCGPTWLDTAAGPRQFFVELTLAYQRQDLGRLILPSSGGAVPLERSMATRPGESWLTVYDWQAWQAWSAQRDDPSHPKPPVLLKARLEGQLRMFQREPGAAWQRRWAALPAWFLNRGLRDGWQVLWQALRSGEWMRDPAALFGNGGRRLRSAWNLASRAGEVRQLEYVLHCGEVVGRTDAALAGLDLQAQPIVGRKRLTYARAANPWHQLTRLALEQFPGLRAGSTAQLELDTGFLVWKQQPLIRIVSQQDQVSALADFAGLAGYFLRLFLSVHVWSFRKPDDSAPGAPQRLPGKLPGWFRPAPEVTELEVDRLPDGSTVVARLTRYARHVDRKTLPPVLLLHGYSASGTTYAHHLLRPGLAKYLWLRGRDVWVADLRTSSGLPSARHPWTLEDVALADIPAVVAHVARSSVHGTVDVFAHCIGAVMTSMAVLALPEPGARFQQERQALPGMIRSLVLSQLGPVVKFSRDNRLRGYLMGYLRRMLPLDRYEYRLEREATLLDELIDRLLATLPYPDREFHIENPLWPWRNASFVRTRHRMDALYGRDFNLPEVSRAILKHIDDFFGPLNTETLAQTIHIARLQRIANRAGRNVYVAQGTLAKRWTFPTLALFSNRSGVTDHAAAALLRRQLCGTPVRLLTRILDGFGHQDCLIGKRAAREVFGQVADFMAQPQCASAQPALLRWRVAPPVAGPLRSSLDEALRWKIGLGIDPQQNGAALIALVPVVQQGPRLQPAHASLASQVQFHPTPAECEGWLQLDVPPPPAAASGWLVLVVYDLGAQAHQDREIYQEPSLQEISFVAGKAATGLAAEESARGRMQAFINLHAADIAAAIGAALDGGTAITHGYLPRRRRNEEVAPALCIAFGSCQYPAGLLDRYPAYGSYFQLGKLLREHAWRPDFLLLLGDQIYSDATAGLFDPTARDDRFVRPYEKLLGNADVRRVLRRLPVLAMLDDHEIADNWEGRPDDPQLQAGCDALRRYLRAGERSGAPAGLDIAVLPRGFPLFVADTRTGRRQRSAASVAHDSIMSDQQMLRLLEWLDRAPPDKPKFIASPSLVLPRRLLAARDISGPHCLRSDAWDGYPQSLRRLLGHIAVNGIQHVVLLSGDEHISCDADVTLSCPGREPVLLRSIHSSGFYAPFPFANSSEADLAGDEDFSFKTDNGQQIDCQVRARFYPGNGFALLRVMPKSGGGWRTELRFQRGGGVSAVSGSGQAAPPAPPVRSWSEPQAPLELQSDEP